MVCAAEGRFPAGLTDNWCTLEVSLWGFRLVGIGFGVCLCFFGVGSVGISGLAWNVFYADFVRA